MHCHAHFLYLIPSPSSPPTTKKARKEIPSSSLIALFPQETLAHCPIPSLPHHLSTYCILPRNTKPAPQTSTPRRKPTNKRRGGGKKKTNTARPPIPPPQCRIPGEASTEPTIPPDLHTSLLAHLCTHAHTHTRPSLVLVVTHTRHHSDIASTPLLVPT